MVGRSLLEAGDHGTPRARAPQDFTRVCGPAPPASSPTRRWLMARSRCHPAFAGSALARRMTTWHLRLLRSAIALAPA
jgi:hypothetical protein